MMNRILTDPCKVFVLVTALYPLHLSFAIPRGLVQALH
jgi:hypothetical protein